MYVKLSKNESNFNYSFVEEFIVDIEKTEVFFINKESIFKDACETYKKSNTNQISISNDNSYYELIDFLKRNHSNIYYIYVSSSDVSHSHTYCYVIESEQISKDFIENLFSKYEKQKEKARFLISKFREEKTLFNIDIIVNKKMKSYKDKKESKRQAYESQLRKKLEYEQNKKFEEKIENIKKQERILGLSFVDMIRFISKDVKIHDVNEIVSFDN